MSSLMDDESPMPSTSKPGVRGTFIDEADLAALTTAAERLQASFRDTMETLPSAKPMPVLEEAAIPDMVLTLPPKRTEMDVHTPPRSSEIVAIPPVFSPLEIASEPPPLKEAPLMVAILQKRATRAALLEAEEVALAMTSSATETAAVPHAEAPGASTATADARASTTPEPPRRRNLAQLALGGLGRTFSLLPLPKRRPDEEDTVDAEFLKDMEAPEASDAVIMIQALFRRNKTLAAFLNRSMLNAPLPPAVPRHYYIQARTPADQLTTGASVFNPLPPRIWAELKVKLVDLPTTGSNLYWVVVSRKVSNTLHQTLGQTERYVPQKDGTIEFRERFQLEVAEEFQQILKFVVYRRVRSMRFQKCNLNIPLLFLIGLPNQKGIFPMLSEAEKRKGLEPQNWVEISVSDLSAPRLSLQLPLEVSALPMPWFSSRTHFMVISRKAQNKDLARRNNALHSLALNLVEDAASMLLHTGQSGADAPLGGFNALASAAKAAGKGYALDALKSIGGEVQKNASYLDQVAKFFFGHRMDTNWEPLLCSRRVCHTNSPRFEQVAVPLNPFVDESAPSDRADFDCPVKIEIFRTKPEAETSTSKDDVPFFLAARAECKLIDLMQPDLSLELRGPRGAASMGLLKHFSTPRVKRVKQFPHLLTAGVKLRVIFAVDFSADSFMEPLVHVAKLGGESMLARAFHRAYNALYSMIMPGDYFHCVGFASLLFGEGERVFGLSDGGESICTSALDFLYGYYGAAVYCLPDKEKSYAEILRRAASSEEAPNYYKILVIFTADGDFDVQATVDAIVAIAKLPISVFLLSLHDEPNSYMKQRLLDRAWLSPLVSSTGEVACRNMVHFISCKTDFTDIAASELATMEMMDNLKKDIEFYYSELDTSFGEPEDLTEDILNLNTTYSVPGNTSRFLPTVNELSHLTKSELSLLGRRNAQQRHKHPEAIFVDEEPAEPIIVDKFLPDEAQMEESDQAHNWGMATQ